MNKEFKDLHRIMKVVV